MAPGIPSFHHAAPTSAFVLATALLLAGCAGNPLTEPARLAEDTPRTTFSPTGPAKLVEVLPPSPHAAYKGRAVVVLPEDAAPIKTIRERHHVNGTRQEIVLDTARFGAGDGVVDVSVQTKPAREGRATDLQLYKPTEDGIRNEIIGRFPDAKMNFVTRSYANPLGPLGIAIGRHTSGASCVFAWQWIADLGAVNAGSSGFDRLGSAMAGGGNPASIRIRLCRRDQTADQIVASIEQLRLGNPDALSRLVKMDRSRADGSVVEPGDGKGAPMAANGPLRPVEGSLESLLPQAKQAPQQVKTASAGARSALKKPRQLVRPHLRQQDWRNPTAYNDRLQPPQSARRQVPMEPGSRRFLAPVQSAQVPGGAAEAPVTSYSPYAPPVQTQKNAADLPLEAFRGPITQQRTPLR